MALTTAAITTFAAFHVAPYVVGGGSTLGIMLTYKLTKWWYNKRSTGIIVPDVRDSSGVGHRFLADVDDVWEVPGYENEDDEDFIGPKLPPIEWGVKHPRHRRARGAISNFRRKMIATAKLKFPRADRTLAMKQVVARFVAAEIERQYPNFRVCDRVKHLDWIVEGVFMPSVHYIEAMSVYGTQEAWVRVDVAEAPLYRDWSLAKWWNPFKFILRGVPAHRDC